MEYNTTRKYTISLRYRLSVFFLQKCLLFRENANPSSPPPLACRLTGSPVFLFCLCARRLNSGFVYVFGKKCLKLIHNGKMSFCARNCAHMSCIKITKRFSNMFGNDRFCTDNSMTILISVPIAKNGFNFSSYPSNMILIHFL
jgi:hypothetical protein